MDNLLIYDKVREVPQEATRPIGGGRLKGMTDINPMWRIKTLTEQFGPCGIGWYYKITDKRLEKSEQTQEIAAFMDIELYVKVDGEWSMPIIGTGGSSFVVKESKGLYMSDECFKMALTDAISVACKALGVGADVYWSKDRTKYDQVENDKPQPNNEPNQPNNQKLTEPQIKRLYAIASAKGKNKKQVEQDVLKSCKCKPEEMTKKQYDQAVKYYETLQ